MPLRLIRRAGPLFRRRYVASTCGYAVSWTTHTILGIPQDLQAAGAQPAGSTTCGPGSAARADRQPSSWSAPAASVTASALVPARVRPCPYGRASMSPAGLRAVEVGAHARSELGNHVLGQAGVGAGGAGLGALDARLDARAQLLLVDPAEVVRVRVEYLDGDGHGVRIVCADGRTATEGIRWNTVRIPVRLCFRKQSPAGTAAVRERDRPRAPGRPRSGHRGPGPAASCARRRRGVVRRRPGAGHGCEL